MKKVVTFLEHLIRRTFSLYVLIVLALWIFVRVVSPDALTEMVQGINVPTLLEKYEEVYNTQNVPEDNVARKFAPVVFLFLLFVIFLNFKALSDRFKSRAEDNPAIHEPEPNSIRNIWVTGFFVAVVLLTKEIIDPFYFTQDDNHTQFLPKILVSIGLLFQGEFPFLDNYQHFGSQLFEIGTYAMLDPVMIFSYAVCKYILHQPYATLELYVIASVFIGAIFLGYAFRMLKIDSFLSFSAIVCFLLSGYFLITIRSWYYVTGIACYLPALFFFFLRVIHNGSSWSWFLSAGLIRGVCFYAGNAQYFVYTLLVEATAYAFFALNKKRPALLIHYFCSILLTIGVALPLLLSQLEMQKEIDRGAEWIISRAGIPLDAIISTVVPYPLSWTPHPYGWGNQNTHLMTNMFHIGFVWALTFFAGIIGSLRMNIGKYTSLLMLATVLFFISAGVVSLIYPLKYFIPLLNKMQIAFKWYPYAVFAIIVYSLLILNDLRKQTRFRKAVFYLTTLSVIISLTVALFGTSTSFYTYAEKPYPSLNKGISYTIDKQEDVLFGLAPLRYDSKPYITALSHNYGCLYDMKTSNFYDPMLPTKINDFPDNLDEYFNKYGITKAVVLKTKPHVEYWEYPNRDEYMGQLSQYLVVYQDEDIVLYDTKQPSWLLKPADNETGASQQILEYDRTKIKAKISSIGKSRWMYHNEYKKGYFINVNGKRGKITSSLDGWCMFELPSGEFLIEIRYMPPMFWKGIMLGLVISILAVVIFFFASKKIAPI